MIRRDEVTSRVEVLDIIPGEPTYVLVAQRAARSDGKTRVVTQKVQVPGTDVSTRLCATIHRGDEIEITVVTEWSKSGYTTYLSSFVDLTSQSIHEATPSSTSMSTL